MNSLPAPLEARARMDSFAHVEFTFRNLQCQIGSIDSCRMLVRMSAERAGFEPAVRFDPHTAFPVPHNRPLCHLSGC
jgi:hypothetical protein